MLRTAFSRVLHKPQIMSHLLMGQCLGPAPEAAGAEHTWRWNKAASETASLLLAYREPGRWCCEARLGKDYLLSTGSTFILWGRG